MQSSEFVRERDQFSKGRKIRWNAEMIPLCDGNRGAKEKMECLLTAVEFANSGLQG
jgi:hypothetical protein